MQANFDVQIRTVNRAVVLSVAGELDLESSPALEQALSDLGGHDPELVILDLRQLDFIDSTGLHVIVKARQRAEQAGRRFALVRGGEQVQRMLGITRVDERMTLIDSPEELLRS